MILIIFLHEAMATSLYNALITEESIYDKCCPHFMADHFTMVWLQNATCIDARLRFTGQKNLTDYNIDLHIFSGKP